MSKKNYFSRKMKSKSRQELEDILTSEDFVDEAKQAAVWELEKRGIKTSFEPTPKTKENLFRDFFPKKSNEERKHYRGKVLFLGISCILIALYFFLPDLLVVESSLTAIEGTTKSSNVRIDKVQNQGRLGSTYTSRHATLIFSFKEHNKFFRITENIGDQYDHEEYKFISKKLKESKKVTVWVRKSELTKNNPKVFQIVADGETVLDLTEVKYKHFVFFFSLILIGYLIIVLVTWRKRN